MKITREEYKALGGDSPDYVDDVCGSNNRMETDLTSRRTSVIIYIEGGMLEFDKKESYALAGPFITGKGTENERHWAAYYISDHSRLGTLKSVKEENLAQKRYYKYSAYTYGWRVVEEVLGKDWFLCYVGEDPTKLCSRSTLTYQELLKVRNALGIQKCTELYEERLKSIEEDRWSDVTPHIELPIKLYLAGNDDSSFTRLFATVEDAVRFVNDVSKNLATSSFLHEEMIFTN